LTDKRQQIVTVTRIWYNANSMDERTKRLSGQLRDLLLRSPRSHAEISRLAQVDPGVVSRFARGERDVRLATLDRLASALSVRLVADQPEHADEQRSIGGTEERKASEPTA
jgi:transcriptional regulator with XRE-family HTH domain